MGKYMVSYTETATYALEVEDDGPEAATEAARAILLGSDDREAAIVLTQPDGVEICCAVTDGSWQVDPA